MKGPSRQTLENVYSALLVALLAIFVLFVLPNQAYTAGQEDAVANASAPIVTTTDTAVTGSISVAHTFEVHSVYDLLWHSEDGVPMLLTVPGYQTLVDDDGYLYVVENTKPSSGTGQWEQWACTSFDRGDFICGRAPTREGEFRPELFRVPLPLMERLFSEDAYAVGVMR